LAGCTQKAVFLSTASLTWLRGIWLLAEWQSGESRASWPCDGLRLAEGR
jgi:hypothetical protein